VTKTKFDEGCLCPSLFPKAGDADASQPGFLSPQELAALKETDSFDPEIHREDGDMIGFGHDDQAKMRQEILNYLNQLDPKLKSIVNLELNAGNRVYGASKDYPDKGSINVTMSQRFTNQYESAQVKFSLVNDPHSWYADYGTINQPRHLLIC
jgi:hypothetical protein